MRRHSGSARLQQAVCHADMLHEGEQSPSKPVKLAWGAVGGCCGRLIMEGLQASRTANTAAGCSVGTGAVDPGDPVAAAAMTR